MSRSTSGQTAHTNRSTATRHSKDDALTDREFELFLEGCQRLDEYYGLQARFVALVGGRLGLRSGEITHMRESWIDWRERTIDIPRHQPCEKGRGGGICGYCAAQAEQMAAHNDIPLDLAREQMWGAKTDMAARSVPFDFDARSELVIERFFERFDRWPLSRQAVNRRVERAAEAAAEIDADGVYPHALRATAATHHAGRGLDVLPLQQMMGWAQASTAECYVQRSVENTRRALHMVHSR